MDHPPSTTSPARRARRALLTTAVALGTLAVPGTVAATQDRPGPSADVEALSASEAVRFVGVTSDGVAQATLPLRSQVDTGLQGLRSLTGAALVAPVAAATPTTQAPAPPTTAPPPPPTTVAPPPPPAPPAPAPAAATDDSVWDRLARCEASGNWAANTGNGYYGGLQFTASTWRSVGGTGLPHQASRETQIEMGKRLQARSGWGSWPACSRKLGLR
jgi:hypothetical protein